MTNVILVADVRFYTRLRFKGAPALLLSDVGAREARRRWSRIHATLSAESLGFSSQLRPVTAVASVNQEQNFQLFPEPTPPKP